MVYNNSSFWRESKWRGVRPGRHICQRSTQVFEVLAHWAETSCGVDGDMLPLFESWCGNVVQSSKGCDAVGYWPLIANICQVTFLIYQPYTTCVCWICNICRKVADVGRFAIIMNCCIDLEFQLHAYDTECVRTSTNSNAIYKSYLCQYLSLFWLILPVVIHLTLSLSHACRVHPFLFTVKGSFHMTP